MKSVLLAVLVYVVSPTWADEFQISSHKSSHDPTYIYLSLIYQEAFQRLGHSVQIIKMPDKRATAMSTSGQIDGELSRIWFYSNSYPSLVRVEEHHWRTSFIALAKVPLKINSWQELNPELQYAIRRGVHVPAVQLPKQVPTENIFQINVPEEGIRMLNSGRVDVYIDVHNVLHEYSQRTKDSLKFLLNNASTISSHTAHLFLHNQHKMLAPQLSDQIIKMKTEGLLQDYLKQADLENIVLID